MQPDLGFHLDHTGRDLDQPKAQRVELRHQAERFGIAARKANAAPFILNPIIRREPRLMARRTRDSI